MWVVLKEVFLERNRTWPVILVLGQFNRYFRMGNFVLAMKGNELYSFKGMRIYFPFFIFSSEEMKAADHLRNPRVGWVFTESILVSSSFSVMF